MSTTSALTSIVASATTSLIASATASESSVPENQHQKSPVYKTLGIILALLSGVFIGISFVMKKKGLLAANLKDGKEAGEGYGYLKNYWWWGGMVLMILGEICNFAAYLFVEAILVTPLGALSVVVTAILSSIFLKERLSFVGKIGCFECIVGSVVIVMNAPKQPQVSTIQDMKDFVIAPGFLAYSITIIVACIGIIVFAAPRWGSQSMMVYISVCSLIGGLSVACIQGIGAAIIAQANGIPQFNQWFTYFIIVFVIATLLVEIIYLNKALNIFNAAIVTPTYYVYFTSSTIITSAIMFQGFKGSPTAIATMCMGFLQICAGVVLLQLSKSAKNVPDTEVFRGDLDQVRAVAEQEEPEYEPKADAIRGTAAIIRRISVARQEKEAAEAHQIFEERLREAQSGQHLAVPGTPTMEWDGVRRRVTWGGGQETMPRRRNTTVSAHAPIGLTRIPDVEENAATTSEGEGISRSATQAGNRRRSMSLDAAMAPKGVYRGFTQDDINPEELQSIWQRTKSLFVPKARSTRSASVNSTGSRIRHSVAPEDTAHPMVDRPSSSVQGGRPSSHLEVPGTSYSIHETNYTVHRDWAYSPYKSQTQLGADDATLAPPSMPAAQDERPSSVGSNKSLGNPGMRSPGRQFSFQNIFHRHRRTESTDSAHSVTKKNANRNSKPFIGDELEKTKTEEELLGLVRGDRRGTPDGETLPAYRDSSLDGDSDPEKPKQSTMEYLIRRVPVPLPATGERGGSSGSGDSGSGKGKETESTIRML